MWNRKTYKKLNKLLTQFPCVCILGARQVGKTTLVKNQFPESNYFDLESFSISNRIQLAPEEFLRSFNKLLILDEIQTIPELTQSLKVIIDEKRNLNGRFIILGSAHPSLIKKASESLAGRVAFIDLETLSLLEYSEKRKPEDLHNLWIRGGYPSISGKSNPTYRNEWIESYLRTFVERDLSIYHVDVQPLLMKKIIQMISHIHGQQWNASSIAASAGVNYHTVNRYLNILESAFIVRTLKPYHTNIKKRLVKSSKVYFRDSGLYHYLIKISALEPLLNSPFAGISWESFIIEEIIKQFSFLDNKPSFYYYRTHAGLEADLLIDFGNKKIPIEIKLGDNIQKKWLASMQSVMSDVQSESGIIIYSGDETFSVGNITVLSAKTMNFADEILKFL